MANSLIKLLICRRLDLEDAIKNAGGLVSELKHMGNDIEGWRLMDPDAERGRVARAIDCYGYSARVHSLGELLMSLHGRPEVSLSEIEKSEVDAAIWTANQVEQRQLCAASPPVKQFVRAQTNAALWAISEILRRRA